MTYTRSWSEGHSWYRRASVGLNTDNSDWTNSTSSTRTGESVPHYKLKIRTRSDATSPYTIDATKLLSKRAMDSYAFAYNSSGNKKTSSFEGFYQAPNIVSHLPVNYATVRNGALMKAYQRLSSARSHLNGLAVVGEFGGVLQQLQKPFSSIVQLSNNHLDRLARSTKGLSGTERQKRKAAERIVADTYIEYAFGLSPLISDTEAIAEALARYRDEYESPTPTRLLAREFQANSRQLTDVAVMTGSDIVSRLNTVHETKFSVQYILMVDLEYQLGEAGSLDRLRELLGFTPENFVPALYEVLPWSWLIDYFSNTSSLIQAAASAQTGLRFVVKTEKEQTSARYTVEPNYALTAARFKNSNYGDRFNMSPSSSKIELVRTTMTRTKQPKLYMPTFELKYPTSFRQAANMAAVLLQRRSPVNVYSYYAKRFT